VRDRQRRPTPVSRRRFLAGLGVTAGAIGLMGATAPFAAGATRPRRTRGPNVLYVTADDLGTRLGAYGHPLVSTPRIDAFARQALLFERCYCQVAICGASRTSILTGLRPESTGVLGDTEQWREHAPEAVSLPRHFRDNGYRTYAIGKINDPRNGDLDDAWIEQPEEWGIQDTVGARKLMREVAGRDDSRPWMLAIGFSAPHCPWTPTKQSLARYDDVDVLAEAGPAHTMRAGFLEECTPVTRPGLHAAPNAQVTLSDADVADIARRYLAEVTDVDTMFGEILDTAKNLRMLDDTIVIFWSGDHGFSLGDSGRWGKWTNYDSATRIPLIMKVPGSHAAGRRAGGLVEAVDMYPTLDELCGLSAPPQTLDGVSFAPLFDDPARPWKSAAFSLWGLGERSVKTERYNLMVNLREGTVRLYDLVEDQHENNDIAPARPDLVAELQAILNAGPAAARPA
jgi:arylsulfatase A-like enzyme